MAKRNPADATVKREAVYRRALEQRLTLRLRKAEGEIRAVRRDLRQTKKIVDACVGVLSLMARERARRSR